MIVSFAAAEIAPPRPAVLAQLGVPGGASVPERTLALLDEAGAVFGDLVAAEGLAETIGVADFEAVYRGEGRNAPDSPVAAIAPRAEHLHLFAVTLGEPLCAEIRRRFAEGDPALAVALDATASVAADRAAEALESRMEADLRSGGWDTPDGVVLRYSPGYCGWDVTGQRALFAALGPGRIGISLNASCLMSPLKSVSGVLIAGPRTIHRFPPTYPFCDHCEERTCRGRLRDLAQRAAGPAAPETV